MNNTRIEFNKRLQEVDIYFNTITLLDRGSCAFNCTDINNNIVTQQIDNELAKILKANGFILLYNLIEATVRNSIKAIFASVHNDSITVRNISEHMRILWLNQKIHNIRELSVSTETLKRSILEVFNEIQANNSVLFEESCVKISGNIDALEIRKLASQFGYDQPENGSELVTIKEKRNKLAHGELTFSEIGRDYTSSDLINLKQKTESYLCILLDNVETFINSKKYKN
ncbi:MAG: MAE_28990/MAE_18760 family HEPN-like nuclease [Bacteroidales bacterium]